MDFLKGIIKATIYFIVPSLIALTVIGGIAWFLFI